MSLPFQAFMAHLPHSDHDSIISKLKEYEIGSYLIGYENEPYEHYHFLVQMTTATYHTFSKSLFKDKYNLRGQARNGLPRQYGKLKKIEDLEKMASYTIKSGNITSNMPQDEIDKYFSKSFQKTEKKKLYQEVFENIESKQCIEILRFMDSYGQPSGNNIPKIIKNIKLLIINYLRINTDINMCRSNVLSYTQFFFKNTSHYSSDEKDELIYNLLF